MRIECTQCDWLIDGRECAKGKNVNHFRYCRFKSPQFNIKNIGNMVHITNKDYKTFQDAIRDAAEKEEQEVTVRMYDLDFIFDINEIKFAEIRVTSGVEHMGEREEWYEKHFFSARCSFRGAFDEDGVPVETDFMEHRISVVL